MTKIPLSNKIILHVDSLQPKSPCHGQASSPWTATVPACHGALDTFAVRYQRMVHFKKPQAFQCFRSFSSLKICLSLWDLTFLRLFLGWHEAFATCWSSRLQQHWGWDTEALVMLGALRRFLGGVSQLKKASIQPCWNAEYDPANSAISPAPCAFHVYPCSATAMIGVDAVLTCQVSYFAFSWRTWKLVLFTTECFMLHRGCATPHAHVDVCCFTSEQLVVEIDGDWYLQYELQNGYENAIELPWNIISNFTCGFKYHVLLEFAT